jgi:hypothetical protein
MFAALIQEHLTMSGQRRFAYATPSSRAFVEVPGSYPSSYSNPPEPLAWPFALKPLGSAEYGIVNLEDGRVRYWIRHEVMRGVTPRMLLWWFKNLEGEITIAGHRVTRYRAWHPYDHVHVSYARRLPDGSIGPGSAIRLREHLGANPRYEVNVITEIERLDEQGFVHNPIFHGISGLARMEYQFTEVPTGTLYENCLIVGAARGAKRLLNPLITRRVFDRARGLAWIRHNIEEVGMLENILPPLYEQAKS